MQQACTEKKNRLKHIKKLSTTPKCQMNAIEIDFSCIRVLKGTNSKSTIQIYQAQSPMLRKTSQIQFTKRTSTQETILIT